MSKRVDALVATGSNPFPEDVHFVTYTLRYNRMKWVTLNRLEKHWERAEIKAHAGSDNITVTTTNITGFTLTLPPGTRSRRVIVDGRDLGEGHETTFSKVGGKWLRLPPDESSGLRKIHGLTGPVDDAFMDSFIFVRPTGQALNEGVGVWTTNELDRAIIEWRRNFRGDAGVKEDRAITDEDISRSNLILWGDPGSNAIITKILPKLPLRWNKDNLFMAGKRFASTNSAPILIYPNPLNPKRYVVLNSGFTFRQGSATSNSLQTPKLPDWAIIDLRTPPNLKWPGLIVDAGFFNDSWELQ